MKKIIIAGLILGLMNGCIFKRVVKGGGGHHPSTIRR